MLSPAIDPVVEIQAFTYFFNLHIKILIKTEKVGQAVRLPTAPCYVRSIPPHPLRHKARKAHPLRSLRFLRFHLYKAHKAHKAQAIRQTCGLLRLGST